MATRQARILVVDDEQNITDLVATALRYEGFDVEAVSDGRSALEATETFRPDLVLLDIMLPDVDGYEILRRLRTTGHQIPVLFLTALDAIEDRVHGLTAGGDDYITKPFSLEELIARTQAILRRTRDPQDAPAKLAFADLELDEESHEVWRANKSIELTPTEFRMLRYFLQRPRHVVSKEEMLSNVWSSDFAGDVNVVEKYVSYLRKKVDIIQPQLIHTIRGVGYILRLPKGSE
ncbi:MAG: response regulator transcription factor [Actinomycetota bacterium]